MVGSTFSSRASGVYALSIMARRDKREDARNARPSKGGALSHVARASGRSRSRMVDVGAKPIRSRTAIARARVVFPPGILAIVLEEHGPKGPVEEVARAAGLIAAKRTS